MSEKELKIEKDQWSKLEDFLNLITSQNESIIILLGKFVYTDDEIRKIIIKGKKEELRDKYIDGYNAL